MVNCPVVQQVQDDHAVAAERIAVRGRSRSKWVPGDSWDTAEPLDLRISANRPHPPMPRVGDGKPPGQRLNWNSADSNRPPNAPKGTQHERLWSRYHVDV